MSDTDDTDLLLLIPPDFFLVHSSELDSLESDCELNLGPDHDEIKDFVVNDLISQVNDLESRVCMIENLETSIPLCSTCNDDSLVNKSVNSLTESDILRVQNQESCEIFPVETLARNRSFQPALDKLCNSFPWRKELNDLDANKFGIKFKTPLNCGPNDQTTRPTRSNFANDTLKQTELLKEIDYFLATKDKINSAPVTVNEDCESGVVSLARNCSLEALDQHSQFSSQNVLSFGECLDKKTEDSRESLALPEVYSLLREMEETQYEIEKKLRYRELALQQTQDNKGTSDITAQRSSLGKEEYRPNMLNSRTTNVEDNYSNSSKSTLPSFNNQNQVGLLLDRVKNASTQKHERLDFGRPRSDSNTQVSILFSPGVTSGLSDDRLTSQNESFKLKCLSPSRASNDRNHLDVVKANLQRKSFKGNLSEFIDRKDSPQKSSSFRRRLLLEKPFVSSKQTYLTDEQTLRSSNKQNQKEDDYLINDILQQTIIKSNALLEKNTSSPHQNPTETIIEQQGLETVGDDRKCCESLQQKFSSNNLLSLSELWNKEPTFHSDDPNKLRQKLEEEKYRRQHCEQQIQALHFRVLEEQEKLAVAIKVDQEKDKALIQITESWRKQNDRWNELEQQRHSLEKQLQDEKASTNVKNEELKKKVERWEKEVSQALDLAAGYKEKSEVVKNEMEVIKQYSEVKLNELSTQIEQLRQDNERINNENTNLSKQLKAYEDRIIEEEDLLSKLKKELEKSNKLLFDCQAEVNALKEQKECLSSKLMDEKSRSSSLDHQNCALQQALNEAAAKEKTAQDEARISSERIEVARTELRALYQGQLETVVKEKLQEFQSQLEAAEAALKTELHLKEKLWAERAHEQCRKLQEKLKIDKQRMEDSCREEINKWKTQLTESERLRSVIENRLQEETNRRADIAQRLHSVMETQWREALNIISNPMQNAYRVQKDVNSSKWPSTEESVEKVKGGGDVRATRSDSTMGVAQAEEAPFFKEGLVTYRASQIPQDHQLKKYIQLLLDRGPGNPLSRGEEAFQESLDQTFLTDSSVMGNKWMQTQDENKRFMGEDYKLGQPSKPPWK